MPSSVTQRKVPCLLCGEPNPTNIPECHRCRFRFPWADELEGIQPPPDKRSELERKSEKLLAAQGLLPTGSCRCRYCQEPVEMDTRKCPHCQANLAYHGLKTYLNPWEFGHDARAMQKVDIVRARTGCLPVLLFGIALVSTLRFLA